MLLDAVSQALVKPMQSVASGIAQSACNAMGGVVGAIGDGLSSSWTQLQAIRATPPPNGTSQLGMFGSTVFVPEMQPSSTAGPGTSLQAVYPSRGSSGGGIGAYLDDSLEQIVYGDFTNKVTVAGTVGQIGLGFTGLDLPADLRDLYASYVQWEWSWSHAGKTALNAAALLPVVGMLKSADEVALLAKQGANAFGNVGKAAGRNAGGSAERVAADAAKARTYPYRPDTPSTHAMERMVTRSVSWDSVLEAVRNGSRIFDPQTGIATYKLPASLSSSGRGVNVVRNEITGKIITVIDKGSR